MTEKERWNEIREHLNDSYHYSDNWNNAIEIFNDRLNKKFFDPLEEIIKGYNKKCEENKKAEGEGFTIITVLCAVIECFAAFRVGKIFKHDKVNGEKDFYYKNESKQIFTGFLLDKNVEIFKNNFYRIDATGNQIINDPLNATNFYSEVRCGLMHEARTKGNWTINTYSSAVNRVKDESIFIEEKDGKKQIYRTVLFYRLKKYLSDYSTELRGDNLNGAKMRRLFARKLDNLFDFPSDSTNFNWWEDN